MAAAVDGARSARGQRGRPSTGVRESVVVAAQEILVEAGVARLSTKEVAKRAGVAESSIFYHFGDRMGLLQAVIQRRLRPVKDVLGEVAEQEELRTGLVALLEALEEFFLDAIPVMAAVQSDVELRAKFAERTRELDIGPHRAVDAVVAHLSMQHADPRIPDTVDLRAAALLLVGAAHQRALQRHLSPSDVVAALPTTESIVDTVMPILG
ncbi:TetR/AcrR family transcriptional regulator [Nocardia vinacea]|uniref:TetR/AcrR family transcriptional regulator n=1 Tax=Nocardia vinacea TaxID=96468 RepID=UPI00030BCD3E|nr:TetR/AcrR family transcriptional regulator [Nocardia vinacea]